MASSTLTPLEPTMEEFGGWLRTPGFRAPKATVLHHTWSPDASQYQGRSSIVAIREYHMHNRGAADIMANAYACPDGKAITGRPLSAGNWAHAYISRDHPEPEAWAAAGHDRMYFNHFGFGLETVGNFDQEDPDASPAFRVAIAALTIVHRVFSIPVEKLFFHRDVAAKSCPGTRVHRDEVRELVRQALAEGCEPKVVLGGKVVGCAPQMVEGEMTVSALPFLQALGVEAGEVPAGVIHGNGRAYVAELSRYCPGWVFPFRQTPQGPRLYPQHANWAPQ
jgi:hypothetical protein